MKTEWKDDWSSGRFKILIQLGPDRHPDLAGIPHVYDYTKTLEDRQVFDLMPTDNGQNIKDFKENKDFGY